MNINGCKTHPASDLFPLMGEDELVDLIEDIKEHGQLMPIIMHEGQVLDGRNRLLACEKLGIEPEFSKWYGDGDPTDWVISINLKRRHLNESQRAMVAAKLANLKRGDNQHSPIGETSQAEAAEKLNVGKRSVERARKVQDKGVPELSEAVETGKASVSAAAEVATVSPEEQREIVAKGETEILAKAKEIRNARTEKRRKERMAKIATKAKEDCGLNNMGRYPVIYADPPWRYEHMVSKSRAIENQYPTMSLDEIQALDVASIAADDCMLFLWAPSSKLEEAIEVMKSWGFEYRTCFVWKKNSIGPGYYLRSRHELLLVCRRGNPPPPPPETRPDSVIEAPRGRHSKKPEIVYEYIEKMYLELPRVELFAREKRDGWDSWGNEVEEQYCAI